MSKSIGQNRILQEMKSMAKERPENLFAQPLENDMFIWHFTILGPESTDFHEGIYHGQIVLPFEYPFKPPDIYFFTKNGRFEDKTKICLTITQYHP
jgi:ubiquitin-conjugating enzyme E2 J1